MIVIIKRLFKKIRSIVSRIRTDFKSLFLKIKKHSFDKKYWSQIYPTDNDALKAELLEHSSIAERCKLGIVEIGILFGDTTRVLAQSNSSVPVYGIDPLIPDSMNPALVGSEEAIERNTEGLHNFHFFRDYSYNVIKTWNNPFDYLFIDGSHIYEHVKKDFEDWHPHLVGGGIVAFHDSTMNRGGQQYWEGPSRLADELIFDSRLNYIKSIGRLTIFQKK